MRRYLLMAVFSAVLVAWIPFETAADEKKDEQKIRFGGDLRGRFEGFWFGEDETGSHKKDRLRIRYRLRLDAKATINDHAALALRVGSGESDNRSGNQSLGRPEDFGPNAFVIRRAYLVLMPFAKGEIPNQDGKWTIEFGRVPIPFVWKNGKDIMILDHDLNPSGVSTKFNMSVDDVASVFANVGYFVIREESSVRDPYFGGVQGGVEGKFSDEAKAGVRGSWFHLENLDADFIERGASGEGSVTGSGGNISDGLTGSVDGGSLSVLETQAFVKVGLAEGLPVTAFGGYSGNLDAEPSDTFTVGKENMAYNFGVEVGDKKKTIKFGVAWYHVEANAFPSQFIDSDLLDGHTNRKGVMVYGDRQVFKGTDFGFKLFASDAIKDDLPGFEDSVENSERTRLQVDLVYKF
ncbi:MAG: putative porin [Candidatus Latescibacterota bacterium]|nr:MAG: putative porin [Candidatus Latescibacterota bacterium]